MDPLSFNDAPSIDRRLDAKSRRLFRSAADVKISAQAVSVKVTSSIIALTVLVTNLFMVPAGTFLWLISWMPQISLVQLIFWRSNRQYRKLLSYQWAKSMNFSVGVTAFGKPALRDFEAALSADAI